MADSGGPAPLPIVAALQAVAARLEAAHRIEPEAGLAVLRSIVDATVSLFDAEAASLALHDPETDRLVFRVAAGPQGEPVVGLSIAPSEGVAGYVFTTGQPLAIADTSRDARFSADAAAATRYIPRSLVAAPLLDDDGAIGVLEVLDKRGGGTFSLRDVELAAVFARQATIAIRATRLERDAAGLLRQVLVSVAGADDPAALDVEAVVGAAVADLEAGSSTGVWALADRISRLRTANPEDLELVTELLDLLIRRADRVSSARARVGLRPSRDLDG